MATAKSTSTKKSKRVVESEGIAHVRATFNNTTITITTTPLERRVITWSMRGSLPARSPGAK